MKNVKNLLLICIWLLCSNVVLAQSPTKNQQNNWQYMGKVWLCKIGSNEWECYASARGLLYGQFDGEKMIYKVYVAEDNQSYLVYENPSYDQSAVEHERKMQEEWDGKWRGPHPKEREKYPQKAGNWYLDVSSVFN